MSSSTTSSANNNNSGSSSTPSLSRYRSYAYPGAAARQPNYLVEHASPAMLCLLRKAEPKPYTPLPPETILKVAQPQDYSLRPSPHVAQQALMDFYRACDGHYGIHCDQPIELELFTTTHPRNTATATSTSATQGAKTEGLPVTEPPTTPTPSPTTAPLIVGGSATVEVNPESFTKEVDQYRLSQFRRQAQHIDTTLYKRVCLYYNTKEGCRRGSTCEFLHLDKNGNVVQAPHGGMPMS